MKNTIHNYIYYVMLAMVIVHSTLARDPRPINEHFDIGRELITSYGYRNYFGDMRFVALQNDSEIIFTNGVAYGITRYLGFLFSIPVILSRSSGDLEVARGLSDISFDLQWHLYRTDQFITTLCTGMLFPTGQFLPQFPIEGTSFSPQVKLISIHSSDRWFTSFVLGGLATIERKNRKPSSFIEYEMALGPKFKLGNPYKGVELYTFLEMEGFLFFPEKINGQRLHNSGGHLVLAGPIISFNSDKAQFLGRILVPVTNRRFGIQDPTRYTANVTLIVTF